MDISVTTNPSRKADYIKAQVNTVQTEKKSDTSVSARTQDEVAISLEMQEILAKQAAEAVSPVGTISEEQSNGSKATTFTTFGEKFGKITQSYADTVREHYTTEHEENLTYDNPSTHIWDKYKNPASPDFRANLSEDERAWAYDQELDLLSGGKHLQMGNPYAFASAGDPPTLASAAMQASQACREQIDQAMQDLLAENGIELPAGTSFRLTVDQDYTIHVTGLEDEEQATAIEQALNRGDNGKNLYNHLKLTALNGKNLGVDYANGHLASVDTQQELDDKTLDEVKRRAGPAWVR